MLDNNVTAAVQRQLNQALRGMRLEYCGGACPVLAFGLYDGEPFLFRFRNDDAQLYLGGGPDNPRLYAEREDIFGDPLLGVLQPAQAGDLLIELAGLLKPPAEWPNGTRRQRAQAAAQELAQRLTKTRPDEPLSYRRDQDAASPS